MQRIKVSLCGQIFDVPKNVLIKSLYFKDIFDEFETSNKNLDNEILYVPRSPIAFGHILTYMLNDKYQVPEVFEEDMKYFLLEEKVENIEMPKDTVCLKFKEYKHQTHGLIRVDVSDETCSKYGYKHGETVYIDTMDNTKTPCKFLGIYDSRHIVVESQTEIYGTLGPILLDINSRLISKNC
jgi:hypothetical protein